METENEVQIPTPDITYSKIVEEFAIANEQLTNAYNEMSESRNLLEKLINDLNLIKSGKIKPEDLDIKVVTTDINNLVYKIRGLDAQIKDLNAQVLDCQARFEKYTRELLSLKEPILPN